MKSFFLSDATRPASSTVIEALVRVAVTDVSSVHQPPFEGGERVVPIQQFHLEIPAIQDPISLTRVYSGIHDQLRSLALNARRSVVWFLGSEDDQSEPSFGAPSYEKACAMLALSFPELLFVRIGHLSDVVRGVALWQAGFDPTCDGFGERSRMRQRFRQVGGKEFSYLQTRERVAIAIDDEEAYSLFHAYVAYRIGYRSIPIASNAVANLLIESGVEMAIGRHAHLTIEDISIRFPDQEGKGLSKLRDRASRWPFVRARTRLFVTSDHAGEHANDNNTYISEIRAACVRAIKVPKPHSGIFRLWELIDPRLSMAFNRRQPAGDEGHSSPGEMKLIAERLLERASGMVNPATTMREAITGAVLATDALELLGTRTPTLAIEALRVKHQFEVIAECQFSGVENHVPVERRLKEIEGQVEEICLWFGDGKSDVPALNARMAICTSLVREFRRFGQFDEEQKCMQVVRQCHFDLWMKQSPLLICFAPMFRYVSWLLSSFTAFASAVALILFVYSVLLLFLSGAGSAECAAQGALITFFTAGKPEGFVGSCKEIQAIPGCEMYFGLVTSTAIVLGYSHLAVLVTHLNSLVNRK